MRRPSRGTRRQWALIAVGAGSYALGLIWMLPASLLAGAIPGAASFDGTVWNGGAVLAEGTRVEWRWAPLRSLVGFGFAADWTANGAGTALRGQALATRGGWTVEDVAGTATGMLLATVAPGLPFVCDAGLEVAVPRATIGGADQAIVGEVRTGAGSCAPRAGGGGVTAVDPLAATFVRVGQGTELRVAPLPMRRRTLVDGVLQRDGRLLLRVTRDGAAALPFLSPPAGMQIETTL